MGALGKLGLDKIYPLIYNGDKIKFCYLKEPNPLHDHVLSFVSGVPKQFHLDEYIDYNRQFEKGFLDPVRTVVETIGWELEKKSNLEEFFC